MSMSPASGGCLCGSVRYEVVGEPLLVVLCHCSMCRRASGAPAVAWATFPEDGFKITKGKTEVNKSSDQAQRQFCSRCGSQIVFTATYLPGLIDVTVASFDHPESLAPSMHIWESRRLPWLKVSDGLPRHPEFPPQD